MRLGGRVAAAIDILQAIADTRRPVSDALRDWGTAHRFAGSGDRAAIGNLVYDALRQRASTAWLMDDDAPAALAFGTVWRQWGHTVDGLQEAFDGDVHAPPVPVESLAAAAARDLKQAPDAVRADVPEWTAELLEANFDDEWVAEGAALAARPPLDLRVNTLKAERDKVAKALSKAGAKPTLIARQGLRIAPGQGPSRLPNVRAEPGYQKGWFEIQDEGSQIVSDLVFARPGEQVFDLCAGAGGKTLALAASMDNKGQVHAYDADKNRLAPIFERLRRAGTRNVQVHAADEDLTPLEGRFDRVLVDAPCTGSGTWRRHPDAKWRLGADQLEQRTAEQDALLDHAVTFLRPGGFLCYVTCSVFAAENEVRVYDLMERNPAMQLVSAGEVWQDLFGFDKPQPWSADLNCITLTPRATQTDGFFFAVLQRAP